MLPIYCACGDSQEFRRPCNPHKMVKRAVAAGFSSDLSPSRWFVS